MKSERRHELRENDLAHAIAVVRRYLGDNGKQVATLAVAVIAVIVVVGIALGSRAATREEAWLQMNSLSFNTVEEGRQSAAALGQIIEEASDDDFVLVALMDLGRKALGLTQQVDDAPDRELNDKARKAFETLLVRFGENALAFGTACSGLATVEENEFVMDHDPVHKERARKHLADMVENPALNNMPFHRIALDRLRTLDSTFTLIRFEPALEPEETEDVATATPSPVSPEAVPQKVHRLRVQPDGTIVPIESDDDTN